MDNQWKPRSSLAIFVSALHLLDLDTLPDWPSITVSTFHVTSNDKSASKNLQARIKATEWALYQLFRLYSSETTRQVLSPNFPPKTPIQSLSLRAALFKTLSELKKNGRLPRESILRKTMLDECKGDKFEDLLSAFSMLVLRKFLADGGRKVLGICNSARPEHVVPLIIAHHVSLQTNLQKRERLGADARIHAKSLETWRANLAVRLQALSNRQPEESNDEAFSQVSDYAFREKVVYAFAADPRWVSFLFEGNVGKTSTPQPPNEDTFLKWQFGIAVAEPNPPILQANQPMSQLRGLISQHRVRIEHLEALQMSLLGSDTSAPSVTLAKAPTPARARTPEKGVSGQRFTKHQVLDLTSTPE
ncbi:uncharacterized protein A1O9_04043 [Exophiala aquamarina CBS 119918]|uniref:HAUS augmin-like complex subunit 6 N-terminal domain-containing protein n=1 Tax=Exophiala aquamarina CBS 119918 TaxID=1182545 RepID=A0A072PGE8_9EURO|nr:uncharacterized protein A1O9_04043 [Exophiala aquamarina CBS 119918]KEF59199.1 hypothetical protein A1O9_04043 [Exophiala aquamarina CBS 119918]